MLRLLSLAACAASALLTIGGAFALGYGCASALWESKPPSPEARAGTRTAT
jgi:hypothetical protein